MEGCTSATVPNVPGARAWLGVAGSCGTHRSGEWGRLRFNLARASKLFALVVLVVCWLCEDLARAQRADKVDDAMPVGGCIGGGMGLR